MATGESRPSEIARSERHAHRPAATARASLASMSTATPATKYQARRAAPCRQERADANTPRPSAAATGRAASRAFRREPQQDRGERDAGTPDGRNARPLIDHRVGETAMMALRARAHLDADERGGEERVASQPPTKRMGGRWLARVASCRAGRQRGEAASRRDRAGPSRERGAGRDLAGSPGYRPGPCRGRAWCVRLADRS